MIMGIVNQFKNENRYFIRKGSIVMDMKLTGKHAIVFAGSKGLGFEVANQLALEGAHVVITSRDESNLKRAVESIKRYSNNSNVDYTVCDMTHPEAIEAAVKKAAVDDRLDILINNSGGPKAGQFTDLNEEDWQRAFELNLLSFVRTINCALPYMEKHQVGRIINLTSSSIKQPIDHLILSNTFRAGVLGLTKSLATELAPKGILINTVGPGRIATDRVASLDQNSAERQNIAVEDVRKASEGMIPLGRYGEPEEFAKTVVFLASFANTYVTGQAILVDGGLVKSLN